MKILLVNKFHYLKGGSEKYYFELANLLKEKGHQIAFFSMQNEKNIKTGEKEYFVDEIDLNTGSKLKALDVIYSKENKKKMTEVLEDFKPDIVHINNFQRQLSESIIDAINEKNIPIVFTAHDLEAVCPNKTMLDENKEICELCKSGKYTNCIKKKCIKSSLLKSILGAVETNYYRTKKVYTEKIDKIVTPSRFYKKQLIDYGVKSNRIIALCNFLDTNKYNIKTKDNGYALYFGRLSKEKGILNLIEAFSYIKNQNLHIAGDGPEREKIEKIIKDRHLENNIKLLGFLNQKEMQEEIANCKFVVVPSIWYENCPYSILETLATGKPVIGADIGGIPELVKDKENGLIYRYNSSDELETKIKLLFENQELVEEYGTKAKKIAQKEYSREEYYNQIIKIYEDVLGEKNE